MWIEIRIYSRLKPYLSLPQELKEKEKWEMEEGATVGDLLKTLNIPDDLKIVSILNGMSCFDKERVLRDGDVLGLFPLMAGG